MAIDERSRHDLFTRLEEILGHEHAAILMEHLPPVGWADVATKQDLDQLRAATKQDLDHLRAATKQDLDQLEIRWETRLEATEHRLMAAFRGEMIVQTRVMIFSMVTAMMAMAGVTLTAVRLS